MDIAYTKLIMLGIIILTLIVFSVVCFLVYRRRDEHAAIRSVAFFFCVLCAFSAIAIPTLTIMAGYDDVCLAWTEGDARFFNRYYIGN